MKQRQLVPLKSVPALRPWATERKCRRLVAEKRIAFHKVGGSVLIDLEDLDAYAEAGQVEARR
jgi:excisionase family DNA binding protein